MISLSNAAWMPKSIQVTKRLSSSALETCADLKSYVGRNVIVVVGEGKNLIILSLKQ